MSGMPGQTTIEGDVSGQVAVGNHIMQFKDLNGCYISVATPAERPGWTRHKNPTRIKPRPPRLFLDRTAEIQHMEKSVQADLSMTLCGATGIGKSTLLHQVAHLAMSDHFKDGIYCLSAYNLKLEDLLQCLFSAFYESAMAVKPNRAQIQTALQEIEALILIDDLALTREEIRVVLDIAPRCIFVLTCPVRDTQGESENILLGGLPDDEAMALFERELGRTMAGAERELACEICHMLKGHPQNIRWMAAKIREERIPLTAIIQKLQTASPETLCLESIQSLPQVERQILAILAAADGRTLPEEHLLAVVPEGSANQALGDLSARNLIESHSPAYSMSTSLAGALAQSWDLSRWENSLIDYFVNWLAHRPSDLLMQEMQGTLLTLLRKAGERKNWNNVIRLGRAMERVFILHGYWQNWNEILRLILTAARALGNRNVEAWALHQYGSQALCLGIRDQAEMHLKHAASIRRAIGDQAGLRVTQHNLSLLVGAPPLARPVKPAAVPQSLLNVVLGLGAVAIVGAAALIGMVLYRPSAPSLTQPANEFIQTSAQTPEFRWDGVLGGATYQIQVDDQMDFSSPEYDSTSASTSQAPDITLKQGVYYWHVRAISRFNKISNWSDIWQFTISIAPSAPTLSEPMNGHMDTKTAAPFFAWGNVDNTVYYILQVDNNNDFTSPEYERRVEATVSHPMEISLLQGEYYWHVRAFNQYDTPGEWSETWKFTISIPSAVPSLLRPADGYLEITTTSPSFAWNSTDNAVTYQIQLDNNQDLGSPEFDSKVGGTNWTVAAALPQGTYYWRVRAFNVYDTPGEWSAVWKVIVSVPPKVPVQISPGNGFVEATTTTPLLEWSSVETGTAYQVQVDNSQDFSSPEYDNKLPETRQKLSVSLAQGDYYWRVRAFNTFDTPSAWTSAWKFTISIAPSVPSLLEPANSLKIESATSPTFKWTGVENAVQYQMQIAGSTAFDSLVYDFTTADTSRFPSIAMAQGVYYWHVRAINTYGTPGKWSSTWQFTISLPPDIPLLSDPANGNYVTTGKPTFSWKGAANAAYYQLQVDNSSAFDSPEYYGTTSQTSRTSGVTLAQGVYYWHVRALNTYDTPGGWSATWQLTVSIPPEAVILLEPQNSYYVFTSKPTFKWKSATGASYYQVQVDNNSNFSSPEFDSTSSYTSIVSTSWLPQGGYYWRVRAFNIYSTVGPWSVTWQFVVSIPPDAPMLYLPADGSTQNTSTPTFYWYGVANATSYEIQIDNKPDFISPEVALTTGAIQIQITSGLVPGGLSEGVHFFGYYWRVRAYNSYGTPGPWSVVWVVTLKVNIIL